MPTSDTEGKDWAKQVIEDLNPSYVVDVGPGEGTYRMLGAAQDAHWVAVEAWGPYVEQFDLFNKYNWVIVSDIRHLDQYTIHHAPDLVILADILEHMDRAEARSVLTRMRGWARNVLVSIPLVHHDQEPFEGNYFEIHRQHWNHQQMVNELGPGLVKHRKGDVLGYYLWSADKVGRA